MVFRGFCDQSGRFALDDKPGFVRFLQAKMRGCEIELLVRKRRERRSLRANAAFHACLTAWAREKGHDVEQLKDDLLALQWGYMVSQNRFTGEVVKRLVKPHTSELNTAEFTELFDLAAEEASKDGHYMEMPDEFKARKRKEAKAA